MRLITMTKDWIEEEERMRKAYLEGRLGDWDTFE